MSRLWNRQLRRVGPWFVHATLLLVLAMAARKALDERPPDVLPGEAEVAALASAAAGEPKTASRSTVSLDTVTWQRQLRQVAVGATPRVERKAEPVLIELTGAVLDGPDSVAFLKDRHGEVHMKTRGSSLEDWEIVEIRGSSVLIRKGAREEELRLKPPS